jgi:FAD:protein FMN transferase
MTASGLMILEADKRKYLLQKKSLVAGTFLFFLGAVSCNTETDYSHPLSDDVAHSIMDSVQHKYFTITGNAQGTTYQIKYGDSNVREIKAQIDSILEDFDWHLSTYVDSSLISDFNNADVSYYCQIVSSILADCFRKSQQVYTKTEKAFNPAVYPLVDFWGFYDLQYKRNQPTQEQLDSILEFISLDPSQVYLTTQDLNEKDGVMVDELCKVDPRLKLDFNAIAQGFAVDLLGEYLDGLNVKNYMVELGGEVKCKGINDKGRAWKIGIDKPVEGLSLQERVFATIDLANKALATSGNYRKYYEEDGVKYSHTIDPRSGRPVEHSLLSVTVVCEEAALADAYATAFMVFGVDKTKSFLEKNPELGVYLIYSGANGDYGTWMSPNLEEAFTQL